MEAASVAPIFLTWVRWIHGIMPGTFTAVEVETITLYRPFQVGFRLFGYLFDPDSITGLEQWKTGERLGGGSLG